MGQEGTEMDAVLRAEAVAEPICKEGDYFDLPNW